MENKTQEVLEELYALVIDELANKMPLKMPLEDSKPRFIVDGETQLIANYAIWKPIAETCVTALLRFARYENVIKGYSRLNLLFDKNFADSMGLTLEQTELALKIAADVITNSHIFSEPKTLTIDGKEYLFGTQKIIVVIHQ